MAVRVSLTHRTTYEYERPISVGAQVVRLRPAPHNRTPLHSYSFRILPEEHFLNWQQDPYGNFLARIVVPEKTTKFEVLVNLVADLNAYNPFDFFLEPSAETCPFEYKAADKHNLEPYLRPMQMTETLRAFLRKIDRSEQRTVDFLVELNRLVNQSVEYVIRMEPGVQSPEETLRLGKGSCRDSAWLLVQVCRHLGLAARFVSGYLIQLKPDEVPLSGPTGPTADFTDLHAWAEVYVPGAGWIGLDATSGLLAAEGHIPLSCAPEPASASPVEGFIEKAETKFEFEMHVERIVDVPRVTGPYSDETWARIVARGHEVDEMLERNDIRLTMGGEPTFVSRENPDAPEWNTSALGEDKLNKADRLTRQLRRLWAPGGFLHHGQGKWYPGEPLPRWAISVVSRKDGEPIWRDEAKFASSRAGQGRTAEDAELFLRELAHIIGIDTRNMVPAFEDVWYYLWRERRLPVNLDPLTNQLSDPLERERLARIWQQGLGSVAGWVLPLTHDGATFRSSQWDMRDRKCFLVPGDSPLGFRLPLESIPWVERGQRSDEFPQDPTFERAPLPSYEEIRGRQARALETLPGARIVHQRREDGFGDGGVALRSERERSESSHELGKRLDPLRWGPGEGTLGGWQSMVRTALCTEVRDGVLKVFLPPLHFVEGFLDLAAALEKTCEKTGMTVQIEGYPPPEDPRLEVFKVTPDPGVIEVNVPPTRNWSELVQQTEELYQAAREQRLAAEKFELDGRHVGSGGGNHLVLGADTPLDSAFLRQPNLLRSLIAFWHNHPALSFLFSGQFIGPTSQAPRVDEGRDDSVYELEIAFEEMDRHQTIQPWLVDRILRNLLTDVTGNTHRAEFCIDKLYSPDSSSGRLGLVEMRAFEMPPHHRMANAQQLLVRGVLAAFAERPYREKLVKWGTGLHDRFMLPHFVHRDLHDALSYLKEWGVDLDPAWFEPHYQFRFPYYGSVVKDDIKLEVRGALEPWHVLGEESTSGGQARYVDSSVERIQVKVQGGTPGRHLICCNGVEVPVQPTGTVGEKVGGIRYRAWQPPSCLHPTIGIDGPLRLDIYDAWNGRAIAGCTYHVVHPGGRANEVRPINAEAAESRRIARFEALGHVPRRYTPLRAGVNVDFPLTLDLRRIGT